MQEAIMNNSVVHKDSIIFYHTDGQGQIGSITTFEHAGEINGGKIMVRKARERVLNGNE